MGEPIGVGDFVECMRLGQKRYAGYPGFVVGALYQVARVFPGPFPNGALCGLDFAGHPPAPSRLGWNRDFFRPIYRPRADFIKALKAPVTRTPQVALTAPT